MNETGYLQIGQTTCHDPSGAAAVPCAGSGQDGEFRSGLSWSAPRFDARGETVTDRLTELAWRLPNINELESLTNCTAANPALPQDHPFAQVRDVYWSSTTSLYEPDWAWALYLDKGAAGVGQKSQARFHVWPLREKHAF